MLINKNVYIDIDILKRTVENLYNLTGLQMSIWDSDGYCVFGYPIENGPFCTKIDTVLGDFKHCQNCNKIATAICRKTLTHHHYLCHSGMHETAVPLISDGECSLFACFGQCVCIEKESEQLSKLAKYCKNKNVDVDYLMEDFKKAPRLSFKKLESLAELWKLCFQALLSNKSVFLRKTDILVQIEKYILNNISQEISIQSICKEFHISKNTLYSLFENTYKTTVNKYILAKRMEIASDLIVETSLTIAEISEKVGKKNYNDFIQTFKKYRGLSPSQYRKKYKIT